MVKLVLVLVLVAAGGFAWVSTHPFVKSPSPVIVRDNTIQAPSASPTQTQRAVSAGVATDASLEADLKSFDAQAESVASDQSSVESSFTDQPVQQTE